MDRNHWQEILILHDQWRIQDFADGGRNNKGAAKLLFDYFFSEKMHENEQKWGESGCPLSPHLRQ